MGIVIGISGVSRSGKSRLSALIVGWYPDMVKILCMDEFVYPKDQIPKIRNVIDWEVPESVDYTKLSIAIAREKALNEIVILEGILIFNKENYLALYDRKIFLEIDYETFISRKKKDLRWLVPNWYMEHIWTSYIVYGMKNIEQSLKLSGSKKFQKELIKGYIDTGIIPGA